MLTALGTCVQRWVIALLIALLNVPYTPGRPEWTEPGVIASTAVLKPATRPA